MPRIAFTAANKVEKTNYDYPKLKLKNGEYARILLLEDPQVDYVHTLRKPQVINGVPQTFMEERRDGSKVESYKMDFVGRPLCLGDQGILEERGADPKNCPVCKLAKDNPEAAQAPQRRYAMHVIRYATKAGGSNLVDPYSVSTLVWSFTDTVFNKIIEFAEEWGDLRKHDLILGPCQNETFQKFDISVAAKGAWLEGGDERKKLTVATFKNNQIADLTIATGSKKEIKWLNEDLAAITEAWNIVKGVEKQSSDTGSSLDEDLGDLLDSAGTPATEEKWADAAPADTSKGAGDLDDLLGDVDSGDSDDEGEKELASVGAAAASDDSEVGSFDDLLADI